VINSETGIPRPCSLSQTKVHEKTLEPFWNFETDCRYTFQELDGLDSLLFQMYDYDKGDDEHDLLCRVVIPGSEFYRIGGFDGRIDCTCAQGMPKGFSPSLKAKVSVNGMREAPSALYIGVISAKGLPPADTNGLADPFCVLQLEGKPYTSSRTILKNKTLEPVWNGEFDDKYKYEEGDNITFEVFDFDKGGKYELMASGTLSNEDFADGVFEGDLPMKVDDPDYIRYKPTLQLKIVLDREKLENLKAAQAEVEEALAANEPDMADHELAKEKERRDFGG